jgi:hypothetical protein
MLVIRLIASAVRISSAPIVFAALVGVAQYLVGSRNNLKSLCCSRIAWVLVWVVFLR